MSERSVDHYLLDFGQLVKESALAAKQQERASMGTEEHQFQLGRLTAYYEVISLMQQQALAFELSLDALSLTDIDPDRDLLGDRSKG